MLSVYISLVTVKTAILVAAFAFVGTTVRAETLTLSALRPNEVIKIEFASSGCFHQSTSRYEISRDTSGRIWFAASALIREWDKQQKRMVDRGMSPIGKVALTAEEMVGVDSLLKFYRQKHPGGCTNVDEITLNYERDGVSIGSEEFRDASCMTLSVDMYLKDEEMRRKVGDFDWELMKQIVTFSKIEKRINPPKS